MSGRVANDGEPKACHSGREMSEVTPGCKRTAAGVIPKDWADKSLADLFTFKNGLNKAKRFFGFGTPIVNYMDVYSRRGLRASELQGRVSLNPAELKNFDVRRGDVFFTRTSETTEEVGIASVMLDDSIDTVFSGFVLRARPTNDLLLDSYKKYCFSLPVVRRQITSTSSYTTRALTNGRHLSAVHIALPPAPEQQAIAEALSEVDELLRALEVLIAKRRAIKQAALQHLLTGRIRLPGFSGHREVRTVAQLADCLDGVRVPLNEAQRSSMKGDYPYCGANGILDYVNSYVIDDDIILLAEDGGYFDEYETRPIAYRMYGKCWVNNHAHILKAKPGVNQGFLFYSLVHKNILPFLASGTRAKLNKSELNKIEIKISRDEAEQAAIADVISAMESEVSSLEARRDKVRDINLGMMQQLLTGRIRLVEPSPEKTAA